MNSGNVKRPMTQAGSARKQEREEQEKVMGRTRRQNYTVESTGSTDGWMEIEKEQNLKWAFDTFRVEKE